MTMDCTEQSVLKSSLTLREIEMEIEGLSSKVHMTVMGHAHGSLCVGLEGWPPSETGNTKRELCPDFPRGEEQG